MNHDFLLLVKLVVTAMGFSLGFAVGKSMYFLVDGYLINLELQLGLVGMLLGFATAKVLRAKLSVPSPVAAGD